MCVVLLKAKMWPCWWLFELLCIPADLERASRGSRGGKGSICACVVRYLQLVLARFPCLGWASIWGLSVSMDYLCSAFIFARMLSEFLAFDQAVLCFLNVNSIARAKRWTVTLADTPSLKLSSVSAWFGDDLYIFNDQESGIRWTAVRHPLCLTFFVQSINQFRGQNIDPDAFYITAHPSVTVYPCINYLGNTSSNIEITISYSQFWYFTCRRSWSCVTRR